MTNLDEFGDAPVSGLGYAGTLDLIAGWRNLVTIFDWKTSKRPKQRQWMSEAFLQTAAYLHAYEWMHGEKLQQSLIVVVSPERSQLFTSNRVEIDQHFQNFLERLRLYQSLNLDAAG